MKKPEFKTPVLFFLSSVSSLPRIHHTLHWSISTLIQGMIDATKGLGLRLLGCFLFSLLAWQSKLAQRVSQSRYKTSSWLEEELRAHVAATPSSECEVFSISTSLLWLLRVLGLTSPTPFRLSLDCNQSDYPIPFPLITFSPPLASLLIWNHPHSLHASAPSTNI